MKLSAALNAQDASSYRNPQTCFLKDIYDHTIQVIETVENFRDMLSSMLDIYLSSVNNRVNEIMKVLTIIATIFMPLTFLAGIYGMNFKYMPELEWHWGYFFVWGVMITIAIFTVIYFRKKSGFDRGIIYTKRAFYLID